MSDTNPINLSVDLKQVLKRYLLTTLPISHEYPLLSSEFKSSLDKQELVIGPYLESLPDFEKGKLLSALTRSQGGYLNDAMADVPHAETRRLHRHQQQALEFACRDEKSILVSTGTGSGKTESFLYPIVSKLLDDPNLHKPGVTAILVYPMNALANDQLYYRIAPLLCGALSKHGITFGRYTGQIRAKTKRADEEDRLLTNPKLMEALGSPKNIPANWLLTREEMLASPPKVLITNYAMLEHILLLPRNAGLMRNANLRFIVLDEIHTYHGAQATEVAFLLRKLKRRLGVEYPLQVFGTSASLPAGEEAEKEILDFASSLLGEQVSFVIRGKRLPHAALFGSDAPTFSLSPTEWSQLGGCLNKFLAFEAEQQTPDVWNFVADDISPRLSIGTTCPEGVNVQEWLAHTFSKCSELRAISEELNRGAVLSFASLAKSIFRTSSEDDSEKFSALAAVIRVGMVAKSSDSDFPLLPCRYHFAVNSIEGLAVVPSTGGEGWSRLRVARNHIDSFGVYYALMTCRKCGQPFFEGFLSGQRLLNQRQQTSEGPLKRLVFWLGAPKSAILDEEDELDTETAKRADALILDTRFGAILGAEDIASVPEAHRAEIYPVPTEHDEEEKAHYLKKCPRCSGRSLSSEAEVITPMHPGSEALASVVTQRVLEALPSRAQNHYDPLPGAGRNLLAFSDNRQDAAFFAPYFERTSGALALRSAICNVLASRDTPVDSRKLAEMVFNFWGQEGGKAVLLDHFGELVTDKDEGIQLILESLGEEFMTPGGRRNSAEALGLVSVTYDDAKLRMLKSKVSKDWSEKYNLTDVEIDALIHFLLDSIRREKAITNFYDIDLRSDTIWGVYNQHRSFDLEGGDASVANKWLPAAKRQNRRSYFLEKQLGIASEESIKLLIAFWELLRNPALGLLVKHSPGFALDAKSIRFKSGLSAHLYICTSCGLRQQHNIRAKCTAFKCEGSLTAMDAEARQAFESDNHYIASYKETHHTTLRAKEHTASLSTELRETIERDFSQRKINLLSCTTTMEMGVDLGDLEAVVNLNVPPNIANYQQRTGRAGRRAQAAPFCVTVARNTNYDQLVVRDFQQYLKDTPAVPFIHLANAELFKRHQYSIILSFFLRDRISDLDVNSPDLGHLFGDCLDVAACKKKTDEELKTHLNTESQKFSEYVQKWLVSEEGNFALGAACNLAHSLPDDSRRIALDIGELRRDFLTALEVFAFEVRGRFEQYCVLMNRAAREDSYKEAGYWEGVTKDYCKQRLIEQFSRRGLIPTYSFPIHSLTLEITRQENKSSLQHADVILSRDASLGISEYAPGAEVVANGRIWKSAGLAAYPKQFMPDRYYAACPDCFHVSIAETREDVSKSCENCGATDRREVERFVEPHGFITNYSDRRGKDPGRNRRRVKPAEEAKLIASPTDEQFEPTELGYISSVFLSARPADENALRGSLFIANKGPYGLGYMRCTWCNYCEPIHKSMLSASPTKSKPLKGATSSASAGAKKFTHDEPLSGQRCKNEALNPRFGIDLVHQFETDVRVLRFGVRMPDSKDSEIDDRRYRERIARTVSEALRLAVTDVMDLYPGEVRAIYRLIGDGVAGFDLILHDTVPGGAGYCFNLGQPKYSFSRIVRATLERLTCPRDCENGCRACLLDYSNQRVWDGMDRKAALEWFESLEKPATEKHGAFQPWSSATFESMLRRAEPFGAVSFTVRSLVGYPHSEQAACEHEDKVLGNLRLLIDWLNRGKSASIYLAAKLDLNPRNRLTLSIYRQLNPFVEDGRLKLYQLEKETAKQWMLLPRAFCSHEIGSPLFNDASHSLYLFDNVVGTTPHVGVVDETYAQFIRMLSLESKELSNTCLREGESLKMWDLKPYQKRELSEIFADVKGAYVKELIIRDPYCGTPAHIATTGKVINVLSSMAQEVLNTRIYCKEIRNKDGSSEPSYQIEPRVVRTLSAAGISNITCRATADRQVVRSFHDREIEVLATSDEGEDYRLKYYLTGGLDYLMDSDSATKVFFKRFSD